MQFSERAAKWVKVARARAREKHARRTGCIIIKSAEPRGRPKSRGRILNRAARAIINGASAAAGADSGARINYPSGRTRGWAGGRPAKAPAERLGIVWPRSMKITDVFMSRRRRPPAPSAMKKRTGFIGCDIIVLQAIPAVLARRKMLDLCPSFTPS